ncbi:MAG TPA: hypothetical protein VJ957_10795, partial [Longimicrobiales bacterium]|nr:hypothetical protein [Longimicrobiales bacterium]
MSQVLDAAAWWLAVEAAGVAALPLAVAVAGALPGRAYAYAKPMGVLIVAYLFWLGVSTGMLANGPLGVTVAFAVLALLA